MSLLKVNEVQNYNGSSLTLTASTVSTSAQLNTGGNISVTGSINVSDDSTTRSNLGLGSIATQDSDNVTVTGGTATLGALTVSGSDSGTLVRITQTGSGNALVVEDSTNPDSTPFVVDSSGNVGIGTSSPTSNAVLHLKDSNTQIEIEETSGSNSGFINFDGTNLQLSTNRNMVDGAFSNTSKSNATVTLLGSAGGSSIRMYTASSNNTTGSERMRIDSSGNLLVGTTDAFAHVSSSSGEGVSISGQYNVIYASRSGGELMQLNRQTTDGQILRFRKNGTTVGSISTNSNSLPSDRNFKKDINDLDIGLDLVKKLKPKTYRYKINDDNSPFMTGLIAQDLEESLVGVGVSQNDSWILQYNADEEENQPKYNLDYSKLIPILIKAIQEQQALIESQQTQIDALTARIEALETA